MQNGKYVFLLETPKVLTPMVLQYTKVISDIRNGGKLPTVMFSKDPIFTQDEFRFACEDSGYCKMKLTIIDDTH